MARRSVRALLAPLAALAVGLGGCAHLPASSEAELARGTAQQEAAPAAEAPPKKVLVTGSRIPRRVSPRTGLPETFSPLHVYTRPDMMRVGPVDLAATLYRLDPAIQP